MAPVLARVARAETERVVTKITARAASLAVDRRHGAPAVPARARSGDAEGIARLVHGHPPQNSHTAADMRCVAALMAVGPAEDGRKAESQETARIAERLPFLWSRSLRHWELVILVTLC